MIQIPAALATGLKWFAILSIVSAAGYGLNKLYDMHLDAIDTAVINAQQKAALKEQAAVKRATDGLKIKQEAERIAMQAELEIARAKSDDLRRMLTIDHDLDRLLQRKPGLILPRVNEGTEEVLKELEELTR